MLETRREEGTFMAKTMGNYPWHRGSKEVHYPNLPESLFVLLVLRMTNTNSYSLLNSSTGATLLADGGIDMVNLKRMGIWSSDRCVEGYLENSRILKESRMQTTHKCINTHEMKEPA